MITKKIINPNEPKVYKSLISRNKIIISILKTLIPKKTKKNNPINNLNNSELQYLNKDNNPLLSYHFLEEIENETKLKRTVEIKNIIYNKLLKLL